MTISSSGGEIVIGDDVFINNYSSMTSRGKIKIGNNTLIGESVKIYDHDHIFNQQALIKNQGFKVGIVNIGSNVWIGSNVTILRGTTIGNNCVVGAGCVLKGNYPDGSLIKSTIGTNCQESIVTYEEITS
ncbi:acyltransferase [Pseudoalteromonas sp. SWXJZ94C]|uniref:acyltransferase n=1 Tax=Pseudoalteromonas sp. SWXJZ94C TaxID=2792065 RepID=UPI0018CCABB4|nr:acyltransferase [Pseudoalteromonas sp. SWXJZ94C]